LPKTLLNKDFEIYNALGHQILFVKSQDGTVQLSHKKTGIYFIYWVEDKVYYKILVQE